MADTFGVVRGHKNQGDWSRATSVAKSRLKVIAHWTHRSEGPWRLGPCTFFQFFVRRLVRIQEQMFCVDKHELCIGKTCPSHWPPPTTLVWGAWESFTRLIAMCYVRSGVPLHNKTHVPPRKLRLHVTTARSKSALTTAQLVNDI